MSVKQRTWQTLSEPKFGKPIKITVWRNGDYDYPGQEITLHSKYLRSWNSILEYLTVVLQPRWGGVKKLYHLDTRKPVLCVQEIKPNQKYVAAGGDKLKFKKNGYLDPNHGKTIIKDKQFDDSISTFMAYTKKKKRTVIYFMVSGRDCQPALKVVLIERDLLDSHMILDYLSYRLDVGEGIQYLCTSTGKRIKTPKELRHGGIYVAVPYGSSFIKLNYTEIFHKLFPSKTPTETKVTQPRKVQPKSDCHKSLNQVDSEEVIKEDDFSHVGDEGSSEDIIISAPPRKLIPSDRAPLQVFGHAFSQEKPPPKLEVVKDVEKVISAQGVLEVKCVGNKCLDKDCRLMRREYESVSGVIPEQKKSFNDVESNSDEYMDQVQENDKESGQDVESTSLSLSDPILDDSMTFSERQKKEEDNDKQSEDSVTTISAVQTNMHDSNLTTFADIAKNRKNEAEMDTNLLTPIIEEDDSLRPESGTSNISSTSTASKKRGVSFMNSNKPEVMTESFETILRRIGSTGFLCPLDLKKPPRISILKNRTTLDSPTAECIPVRVHSSFLTVRSSISDEKSQTMQRRLSELVQKGVDIISNEDVDVSYLDLTAEEDDNPVEPTENDIKEEDDCLSEDNDEPEDVKKDDLVYEETDEDSVSEDDHNSNIRSDVEEVLSENGNSKAVQKGWMINEDAFDKSIQSEDKIDGISAWTQTDK